MVSNSLSTTGLRRQAAVTEGRFIFYFGSCDSELNAVRQVAGRRLEIVCEFGKKPFWLFLHSVSGEMVCCETDRVLGCVWGYVRHEEPNTSPCSPAGAETQHSAKFLSEVVVRRKWPLGTEVTGSFSAVGYDKAGRSVVLCTDVIGYRPVYYSRTPHGLVGASHLGVLSHCLTAELDVTGLLQRLCPPAYGNYGRRTLLKSVERLLPGERLEINEGGDQVSRTFDNTLFQDAREADLSELAEQVWACLQHETRLATMGARRVHIALSGGWDSRLLLPAVAGSPELQCWTYGDEEAHETHIAKRCAQAIGARHRCHSTYESYFPTRVKFAHYVQETEAMVIADWLPILEAAAAEGFTGDPLLIGDHCQSIDARYIETHNSRAARRKSYVRGLLGLKERFEATTAGTFDLWQARRSEAITESVWGQRVHLVEPVANSLTRPDFVEAMQHDLSLSFQRVRDHLPPAAVTLDEIFNWHHRTRFYLASQNLLCAAIFRPISPAMSLRFLRLISAVHPRWRLRRRLMDAIARLPDFDHLARIPSAQIPWLSARAPAFLREAVWGLRSSADQALMRLALRRREPDARQRVLPTMNLVRAYRLEGAEANARSWFSGRLVTGNVWIDRVCRRAEMTAWPLINSDITAPANTSILLDLCHLNLPSGAPIAR